MSRTVAEENALVTTLRVVTHILDALRRRITVNRYDMGGSASGMRSVQDVRFHAERGNENAPDGFDECLLSLVLVNLACRVNSRGMPGEDRWGETGLRRPPSSTSVGNVLGQNKFGRRCCTLGRRKSQCALYLPKRVMPNRRKPLCSHHLAPVFGPFVGFPPQTR